MLYLAQVQNNPTSGEKELSLLASQKADNLWQLSTSDKLPYQGEQEMAQGILVIIELGENGQIINIENAKDWVIELIKKHLAYPSLTPEWVEKEQERIEQGRQEITAKSLDITRRQLELETQREQIQALENQLKKEQVQLEKRQLELEKLAAKYNNEQ